MNFFARLEKSLEEIIEGAILSRFRSRLQPIEIARSLWNEIRSSKRVSVQGTYIPNFFLVTLSESDFNFLEPVQDNVELEIIEHLEIQCRKRDFDSLGPMVIRWMKDKGGKEGEFFISSDFVKEEELPQDIKEKLERRKEQGYESSIPGIEKQVSKDDTIIKEPVNIKEVTPGKKDEFVDTIEMDLSKIDRRMEERIIDRMGEQAGKEPSLLVVEGFDKDRRFVLDKTESVIGRDESCDIVINDPGISRSHAVIKKVGNEIIIEDLHSRSGLFINGKKVEFHTLHDGDTVKMGITTWKLENTVNI